MYGALAAAMLLLSAEPAADFDKDGVPDLEDDCPTDPGNAAKKGCPGDAPPAPPPQAVSAPLVSVQAGRIELHQQVRFRSGAAAIERESYPLLEAMALAIKSVPEPQRVRVEGHTDNVGGKAHNLELSRRRAQAVLVQLVHNGVPEARLEAAGRGAESPIADNKTPLGRATNRRVELVILPR